MRLTVLDLLRLRGVEAASRPARPFRQLHLAGVAGVILLALAAAFFTPTGGRTTAWMEASRWGLIAGLLAVFAVGYRAIRAVPESPRLRRVVAGYALALTAAAAAIPAFHSNDLFVYVNIGWQQAEYGVNPYKTRLFETPNWQTDPMFVQQWQFVPCSYGFLFALEAKAAADLGGRNHAAVVTLLKLAAVATFFALGLVAWLGGRALGRPDPIRGVYLILWNPLLLLHCVSNAHNDLQFALGVAVAVLGFARGWWPVVFPALVAAGLVKYLSAVLVPFFVVASVRRFGWVRTGVGGAAGLALAAACWWPYRDGFDAAYLARMGDNLTAIHTSLASAALFPYELAIGPQPLGAVPDPAVYGTVKAACWLVFAAVYTVVFVRRVRAGGGAADLARDVVVVLLAVLLTSPKYHAWYLGMVLPQAVWLPVGSRARRAVLALGVANLLSFTFVSRSHLLDAVVFIVLPLRWALRHREVGPPAAARVPAMRSGRAAV